jgi:hypothetical protein
MVIKPNTKKRTCFLFEKNSGVEIKMTTPLGQSRKAKMLTLNDSENRIQLNGRQIAALVRVLEESYNQSA